MARFNEILVGRYNNALRKIFGMKGAAPAPQAGGEFMPVLSFFYGAENRFLEQWNRYGMQVQQAATAANTSGMRMRNPAGSNVVAVLEKLLYANFTATADQGQWLQGPIGTDLTTPVTNAFARFDPRGNPQPSIILSSQSNPSPPTLGAGTSKAAWVANATSNYDVIITDVQEITLLPGDAIQIQSIAVNISLNVSVWWRERALEESERQ